jgi:hypothetical protein
MYFDACRPDIDPVTFQVTRPPLGHLAPAGIARTEKQEFEFILNHESYSGSQALLIRLQMHHHIHDFRTLID